MRERFTGVFAISETSVQKAASAKAGDSINLSEGVMNEVLLNTGGHSLRSQEAQGKMEEEAVKT